MNASMEYEVNGMENRCAVLRINENNELTYGIYGPFRYLVKKEQNPNSISKTIKIGKRVVMPLPRKHRNSFILPYNNPKKELRYRRSLYS